VAPEVRLFSLLAALPLAVTAAGGSAVVAKVSVPGTPCGVAGSPGAVWVTDASNARLVKIDPATNAVVKSVPTDRTPCELKYASGSIWVVTQSGRVDRFDPATARKLASIPVGRTTYDLTSALGAIWVTNRNDGTIQRINSLNGNPDDPIKVGSKPKGIACSSPATGRKRSRSFATSIQTSFSSTSRCPRWMVATSSRRSEARQSSPRCRW
jgi:streptogramin lyase